MTPEALAFGDVTHFKACPNALLLSTRKPTVKKKRARHASCSCAYPPTFVLSVALWPAATCCEVADTTSTPGAGNPVPPRELAFASVLLNWPPTDVEELSVGRRSNFAVPE